MSEPCLCIQCHGIMLTASLFCFASNAAPGPLSFFFFSCCNEIPKTNFIFFKERVLFPHSFNRKGLRSVPVVCLVSGVMVCSRSPGRQKTAL